MFIFFPSIFVSLLLAKANAEMPLPKACYAPNGRPPAEHAEEYMPCLQIDGVESMCCALNRTINVDRCLPNGLCSLDGDYFRNYCTDPTWKSPNCAPLKNLCADLTGTPQLTRCTDGSWCCGKNNNQCCKYNQGSRLSENLYTIPPLNYFGDSTQVVVLTSATQSNPSFSTISTSTTSLASQSANPAACITGNITLPQQSTIESSKKGDPKTVGAAVGVSMGVMAIAGMLSTYWFGRKQGMKRANSLPKDSDTASFLQWRSGTSKNMADVKSVGHVERYIGGIYEVPAQVTPVELAGTK